MGRTALIVDDHRGVGDALGLLLSTDGWDEILVAGDSATAIQLAARHRPDVMAVDLTLGDERGMDLVGRLIGDHPHRPVVVVTASGSADNAVESLTAGAAAFIPKSTQPDQILAAFRSVMAGECWLPGPLIGPVTQALIHPPPPSEWKLLVATLSPREREVLELMVAGLSRAEIAERLTISINTVRTHVKHILARLGVHSSLEAGSVALRAGIRPPPN